MNYGLGRPTRVLRYGVETDKGIVATFSTRRAAKAWLAATATIGRIVEI